MKITTRPAPTRRALSLALLLFFLGALSPWRGSLIVCLTAAEDVPAPIFLCHTAEKGTLTGPLEKLGEDWSCQLGGDKSVRVAGAELLSLRRVGLPLPPYPLGPQVIFANGDQVTADILGLDDENVQVRSKPFTPDKLSLPLASLSALWLTVPDGADSAECWRRRLSREKRAHDVVTLRNGDVIEGTLTAFDAETKQITVETDKKAVRKVSHDKAAVIALNTELARLDRPKGVHARLVLTDGSRLTLSAATCDGKSLTGAALFGGNLTVKLNQVAALDLYQGRAVYLSDLEPSAYQHTPYLGVAYPFVRDSVVRDLRLGGGTFDKGLGMHSASRLTYDVASGYRRFEASVGLDDQLGRGGSVLVQVLVDGKARDWGWSKELTARDGPKPVRIDLAGARVLTLVVDYGANGHVQDHVNWVDARLVK